MREQAMRIHAQDTVAVALVPLQAGQTHCGVALREDIAAGHKFALCAMAEGEPVVKYAAPIGHATRAIAAGAWVHTHNCATSLSGIEHYTYAPHAPAPRACPYPARTFSGYLRADGRAGIRNELWIVPTVGCVNAAAQRLAALATARVAHLLPDGVHAFPHPYGCSQLGGDHAMTQRLLAAMVRHPNAGGVLVLGLGCENNHIDAFRQVLGPVDGARVRFLATQDVPDEIETGLALLDELAAHAAADVRQPLPLAKLVIGLKCGGSDGFSGITANPLLGALSDALTASGGSTVLTEVPEMFGAETLLMDRCRDRATFDRAVALIDDFKRYFQRYGQVIYENPSPGNKEGGISTLEEKSLGCTQKGGTSQVVDVLDYGAAVSVPGLNLLSAPGNDLCAVTALMAAGCQAVLFTTGRGTPLGAPVPTLKVSTHTGLAARKPGWIDFDAGPLLDGTPMDTLRDGLMDKLLAVAAGERARNEVNGDRQIAIFKDGVTL